MNKIRFGHCVDCGGFGTPCNCEVTEKSGDIYGFRLAEALVSELAEVGILKELSRDNLIVRFAQIISSLNGSDVSESSLVSELAYIVGPELLDHHPPFTTKEDVIKAVTKLAIERNGKQ